MLNKKLAELFKQKFLLEREADEEKRKVLKDFLWGVFNICLLSVFFIILRRVFQDSETFTQNLEFFLPWIAPCLCLFYCPYYFFLLPPKNSTLQKKKNQWNRTTDYWGVKQRINISLISTNLLLGRKTRVFRPSVISLWQEITLIIET